MEVFAEAKQCFKNKDWVSARYCLLKIAENEHRNNNKVNRKTFEKLGDLCVKMDDFMNAKLHYEKSMHYYMNRDIDEKNKKSDQSLSVHLKYANLLHYELNQHNKAQTMYLRCIQIHKYNNEVYFHFAKLLNTMKQYTDAKKYFLQCLEFDETKACVHYHFSVLLFYKLSDKQNGIKHIKKAIVLKHNITKYHLEFALMLKSENDAKHYDEINKQFEIAMQLSNNQDALILIEYGKFLIHCTNNKGKGSHFMRLASILNENTIKPQEVLAKHTSAVQGPIPQNETKQSGDVSNISNNTDDYTQLKYIVYDFDETITSQNVFHALNGDISHLSSMDSDVFCRMFGYRDRITRLANHFKGILSKNIKIIWLFCAYSDDYVNIVTETLKRAYLTPYFHELVNIKATNESKNKLCYIQHLKHKFHLNAKELLYVDDNFGAINLIKNECFSVFISEKRGLTLRDFENIEHNIGIPTTNYSYFKSNLPSESSLKQINIKVYHNIKTQISRKRMHIPLYSLDIIQWIHSNLNAESYKDAFLEFAEKYNAYWFASNKHYVWTVKEILIPLMELEPLDTEFTAKCYGSLGLFQKADELFKNAMIGKLISTRIKYGYFLFKMHRFSDACVMFQKAIEMNPISIKSLLGIARTLRELKDFTNAEYYFKKVIAIDPNHDLSHFRYANLLRDMKRYQEAHKHFTIAIKLWPHSAITHYVMALNLLDMKNYDQCKYHLEQCLNLRPNDHHAKRRYHTLFGEYYNPPQAATKLKQYVLNGEKNHRQRPIAPMRDSEREFDIFWFHKLQMWLVDDVSHEYRQQFIKHRMNNITALFTMYTEQLRDVVGITNEKHLEMIMDCVDKEIIAKYDELRRWLDGIIVNKKLLNEYCEVLLHNKQPVYSLESFSRTISSVSKLMRVLEGLQHGPVIDIWQSYNARLMSHDRDGK